MEWETGLWPWLRQLLCDLCRAFLGQSRGDQVTSAGWHLLEPGISEAAVLELLGPGRECPIHTSPEGEPKLQSAWRPPP